jgi:hypothetical protein
LLGTPTGTTQLATGLLAATNYIWHVKTDCSNNSQDVTFTTSSNTSTFCPSPAQLTNSNITQSAVTLSWTPVTGATSYTVQYKPTTTSTWITTAAINTSSTSLGGLNSNTSYHWHVKADCSAYSADTTFTTAATSSTSCSTPGNLSATNISSTSATLNWNAVTGAQEYTVKYYKVGTKNWTFVANILTTAFTVTGLLPGTNYKWTVNATCSGGAISNFPNNSSFATSSNFIEGMGGQINWYPNPAKESLSIDMNSWSNSEAGTAVIYALTGAKIKSFPVNPGHNIVSINDLASGLYLLHIMKHGGEMIILKFAKE